MTNVYKLEVMVIDHDGLGEKGVRETVIPEIVKTMRQREEAGAAIRDIPLFVAAPLPTGRREGMSSFYSKNGETVRQHFDATPAPSVEQMTAWLDSDEGKAAIAESQKRSTEAIAKLDEARKVSINDLNTPYAEPVKQSLTTEPTADECIALAQALEQQRALKIVESVTTLSIGGATVDMPTPFHAGYQMACEEITHRLRTEQWEFCGVPIGLQNAAPLSQAAEQERAWVEKEGAKWAAEPRAELVQVVNPVAVSWEFFRNGEWQWTDAPNFCKRNGYEVRALGVISPAPDSRDALIDAVLDLNKGWNAKEPEHLIAERIDLARRIAIAATKGAKAIAAMKGSEE